ALAYYRKALAIVPDDAEAMLGLALVYRRVGLLDESAHWLEKCLGFSETVRRAIVTIVQVAGESKDEKYAIRLLESAIESVGEHQALLVALGELLIKQGETLRGSSMLKKALESPSSV
nr:tetratricopeptide repeat protein [Oligoflexales bacterium]